MGKKVLVLGDIRDGALRNVSFEAIAAAKLIADGGEVVAALFGESIGDESFKPASLRGRPRGEGRTFGFKRVYDGRLPTSITSSTRHRKA